MSEPIDRQSALSVCKECCLPGDDGFIAGYNTAIKDIREAIKELPTIEPEVRHGRWIQRRNGEYYCTKCGHEERFIFQKNYCPTCGAHMDATNMNVDDKGGADNG